MRIITCALLWIEGTFAIKCTLLSLIQCTSKHYYNGDRYCWLTTVAMPLTMKPKYFLIVKTKFEKVLSLCNVLLYIQLLFVLTIYFGNAELVTGDETDRSKNYS